MLCSSATAVTEPKGQLAFLSFALLCVPAYGTVLRSHLSFEAESRPELAQLPAV